MAISVSLTEHVGSRRSVDQAGKVIGTFDVKLNQYFVMVQTSERLFAGHPPVEFGIVHFDAGCPLNPLPIADQFPADAQAEILRQVNQQLVERGHAGNRTLAGLFGKFEAETEDEEFEDFEDDTEVVEDDGEPDLPAIG